MIRVAIVEDEELYRVQLSDLLRQYETLQKESFRISFFADGDEIVSAYRMQFDIIFMDVKMKFMDGMSAAGEIRKMDSEVIIIFITNMHQYAVQGYAVEALAYLVKPISWFAFSECVRRAADRIKRRKEQSYLYINVKGGMRRIAVNDIYYIESQGHAIYYHTVSDIFQTYGTLKEAERLLDRSGFYKCNKGCLVNLEHVDSVKDRSVVIKSEELPISRGKKQEFLKVLVDYWSEVRG